VLAFHVLFAARRASPRYEAHYCTRSLALGGLGELLRVREQANVAAKKNVGLRRQCERDSARHAPQRPLRLPLQSYL